MSDYNNADIEQLKNNWRGWWSGELKRPMLSIVQEGDAPLEYLRFLPAYPASMSAEEIIDIADAKLAKNRYFADALPFFWIDSGAGVLAACIGGEGKTTSESVWFEPGKFAGMELKDFEIKFDPDSPWARRITEITFAAVKRWGDKVLVGMTDIGGASDVLSALRPSEMLMYDFYDEPEEIIRLMNELHREWWCAFDYWREVMDSAYGGRYPYSCWTPLYSDEGYYMFQSDVSYMLSPEHFKSFIMPELSLNFAKMEHSFYHLDGIGELPHLDCLLADPHLAGIQWIPGAGQKPLYEWGDVLNKIADSGKKLQFQSNSLDEVLRALDIINNPSACAVVCQTTEQCDQQLIDRYVNAK